MESRARLEIVGHGLRAERTPRAAWVRRYRHALIIVDACAAAAAAAVVLAMHGMSTVPLYGLLVALALPVMWPALVATNRAYTVSVGRRARDGYQGVFTSFCQLVALIALGGYALGRTADTGVALAALLVLIAVDVPARAVARLDHKRRRPAGYASSSVIVVGEEPNVDAFTEQARIDEGTGVHVIGGYRNFAAPVIARAAADRGADAVVVLPGAMSSSALRHLAWDLEGSGVKLLVDTGLTEVARARLHLDGSARTPLLQVSIPRFTGPKRLVKNGFDRVAATLAIIVLSPVLLGIALAVRLTSRGPVLFRQERVGLGGRRFTMLKFRSMADGAEALLPMLEQANEQDGPLFKIAEDPRITRLGRMLRRYSVDELPQLFNVLAGDMSLVGPRPPLPREVAEYPDDVRRRLLVKPGITGLWQVCGRSDLTWAESVRLDLHYVENWSLGLDLALLAKTVKAIVRANGAY
ncbi:MAG TPA: sugar transferase [Jatrophihabitans sp.]|nr:sugar transferase [Jatrophihabitans sp.]